MAICHMNHNWTNNLPDIVGDRYYGQDLNDDFNYLKHIPYEMFFRGKIAGIIAPPRDTIDNVSNVLTLTGGLGAIRVSTQVVNEDAQWLLPPTASATTRYERVVLQTTNLSLPQDDTLHTIVATPREILSTPRVKTATQEQYNSRSRWVADISIDDTYNIESFSKILVGFCWNNEYILLIDGLDSQIYIDNKDTITVHKWHNPKHYTELLPKLRQYSGFENAKYIKAHIVYNPIGTQYYIENGYYKDCVFEIPDMYRAIGGGTFENCLLLVGDENSTLYLPITGGTFNNCRFVFGHSNSLILRRAILNNCIIDYDSGNISQGNAPIIASNCVINMKNTASIFGGGFDNCKINIDEHTSDHVPIGSGYFANCVIDSDGALQYLINEGDPHLINTSIFISNATSINGGKFQMCYIGGGSTITLGSNSKGVMRGDTIIAPFS